MTGVRAAAAIAGTLAAAVLAAPAQAAGPYPASPGTNCAAGYMADADSGNCWQMAGAGSPTIGNGPCMPGRVGTCLGYLSNNPIRPGDTLDDSWP